jgi:hypothetical protein
VALACGRKQVGYFVGLDFMQSCEEIPWPQSANTRCQLKASDNQNLDAGKLKPLNEGIHAARPPPPGGGTYAAGFGAVRRADEIGVAGEDLPSPAAYDVR